ncbi:flagellar type III secretion system pore protein FliP [Rhodobacteraceae bacterium IMCC1335]
MTHAQTSGFELPLAGSLRLQTVQIILLITVISIAPGILIMVTCFPFILTVLSILRQAIGVQQAPPNMLLISLALFLTYYIMEPVFQASWVLGVEPMIAEEISVSEGFRKALEPLSAFMMARVDGETLQAMQALRAQTQVAPQSPPALSVLVPSFMLSEIARAFQIGFLLFLPFLIIDLVVSAILMSMGMMMVPPALVALPFKLAFFVVSDGWQLIAFSLVRGYV